MSVDDLYANAEESWKMMQDMQNTRGNAPLLRKNYLNLFII